MPVYNFDKLIERSNTESSKWRKYGPGILPLWVADMDFASPEPVIHALRERVEHGIFGYPDDLHIATSELPDLHSIIIERLAKRYRWHIQAEDIILLPGVIPGLNLAARVASHSTEAPRASKEDSPNSGILVLTPVYPPILRVAGNTGGLNQEIALLRQPDGSYQVDWPAFESAVTSWSRLFILCNPHNPVGKVFQKDELERIAEICLRNKLLICSDEIHCDLVYPGSYHIPIASLDPEIAAHCITLMAPSKTFNLPGLQCAFAIITNPELRKRFNQNRGGLVSWVGIMGLVGAQAAYSYGQEWLEQLLAYLKQNRDFLVEYIRRELPQIEVGTPASTYLAWLDCRGSGLDGSTPEVSPYTFFLDHARVALNDGVQFGGEGRGFVRLNFGCPRSRLEEALERMKTALLQR